MDARRWRKLVDAAEEVTQATLHRLPPDLREPAATVPLVFDPWMRADIAAADLDPDSLGLFVGDPINSPDPIQPMPPQIFLFLESIWDFVDGDDQAFRDEVRITYLHELGHYLGLDESDLEARGLE